MSLITSVIFYGTLPKWITHSRLHHYSRTQAKHPTRLSFFSGFLLFYQTHQPDRSCVLILEVALNFTDGLIYLKQEYLSSDRTSSTVSLSLLRLFSLIRAQFLNLTVFLSDLFFLKECLREFHFRPEGCRWIWDFWGKVQHFFVLICPEGMPYNFSNYWYRYFLKNTSFHICFGIFWTFGHLILDLR